MIKQQHFKKIESTQDSLIEIVNDESQYTDEHWLISTEEQLKGKGRHGKSWLQTSQSLAFSLALKPCPEISLTSLEIGWHIVSFFKEEFDLKIKLKWPNDILNEQNEKIGGILLNLINEDLVIIGVGINICYQEEISSFANIAIGYDYPASSLVYEELFPGKSTPDENIQSLLPRLIAQIILKNRLSSNKVKELWPKLCSHLNQKVSIYTGLETTVGIFQGIGEQGEAIIKSHDKTHTIFSGTLRLILDH
jgi:biotin-[acetyl-CoA-carboxylase] ligase BirA-like protein